MKFQDKLSENFVPGIFKMMVSYINIEGELISSKPIYNKGFVSPEGTRECIVDAINFVCVHIKRIDTLKIYA